MDTKVTTLAALVASVPVSSTQGAAAQANPPRADISANANTTNHPTMTKAVTAPAITFLSLSQACNVSFAVEELEISVTLR